MPEYMTRTQARRAYTALRKRYALDGCAGFALLSHGAGTWSIEYRTVDGSVRVDYLL